MGDNYCGYRAEVFPNLIYRGLDLLLVLFVQGGSRLIQEQNFRLLDEGSCNGDPLFLAARELATCVSDIRVDPLLPHFLLYKVPSIGSLERFAYLLVRSIWVPIEQVIFDSRVKEDGLLANIADFPAKVSEFEGFDIVRVNQYASIFRVVEPLYELDNGTLTRT